MKRFLYGFIGGLLLMSVLPAFAQKLSFYGRDAATVGIYITDLATGKAVAQENINQSMIPASILKSVTSATALNLLNEDFRYNTDVILQGDVNGNRLNGNLVVRASGDPTIESSYFVDRKGFLDMIVSELKSEGITSISGQILVDESTFSDLGQIPQWVIEDTGWDYGAGFYGFNYSNNIFKLYTQSERTVPDVPYIDVIVDYKDKGTDVERGINSNIYIVSGRNVNSKNFYVTTTMNSPSAVFIQNLTDRLQHEGITVEDKVVNNKTPQKRLLLYESPVNKEMLRTMMFHSDNLMAEATLRALAPGQSRDAAIKKELQCWKDRGIGTEFIKIADGSGLARVDRVTPKFITQVLTYMSKNGMADTYLSIFPKVGKEGTVKSLLKGTALEGRMALKSGSMNGVHCYAGYKLDSSGKPTHTVVVIINNFFCSRSALRKSIEQYLLSIFK